MGRFFALAGLLDKPGSHTVCPLLPPDTCLRIINSRVFKENMVVLGFLYVVCFLYKANPTNPRKKIAVGKSGPNATFCLVFLGWVGLGLGSFVGFITMVICFPTQQNLVNRKQSRIGSIQRSRGYPISSTFLRNKKKRMIKMKL